MRLIYHEYFLLAHHILQRIIIIRKIYSHYDSSIVLVKREGKIYEIMKEGENCNSNERPSLLATIRS